MATQPDQMQLLEAERLERRKNELLNQQIRDGNAIFSTSYGEYAKMIANTRPAPIIRSDVEGDLVSLVSKLRLKYPRECKLIKAPILNIYDYFDHYDVCMHGENLVNGVLNRMAMENVARALRIQSFASKWQESNLDRIRFIDENVQLELFTREEKESMSEDFLFDALDQLKYLKEFGPVLSVATINSSEITGAFIARPFESFASDFHYATSMQRNPSDPMPVEDPISARLRPDMIIPNASGRVILSGDAEPLSAPMTHSGLRQYTGDGTPDVMNRLYSPVSPTTCVNLNPNKTSRGSGFPNQMSSEVHGQTIASLGYQRSSPMAQYNNHTTNTEAKINKADSQRPRGASLVHENRLPRKKGNSFKQTRAMNGQAAPSPRQFPHPQTTQPHKDVTLDDVGLLNHAQVAEQYPGAAGPFPFNSFQPPHRVVVPPNMPETEVIHMESLNPMIAQSLDANAFPNSGIGNSVSGSYQHATRDTQFSQVHELQSQGQPPNSNLLWAENIENHPFGGSNSNLRGQKREQHRVPFPNPRKTYSDDARFTQPKGGISWRGSFDENQGLFCHQHSTQRPQRVFQQHTGRQDSHRSSDIHSSPGHSDSIQTPFTPLGFFGGEAGSTEYSHYLIPTITELHPESVPYNIPGPTIDIVDSPAHEQTARWENAPKAASYEGESLQPVKDTAQQSMVQNRPQGQVHASSMLAHRSSGQADPGKFFSTPSETIPKRGYRPEMTQSQNEQLDIPEKIWLHGVDLDIVSIEQLLEPFGPIKERNGPFDSHPHNKFYFFTFEHASDALNAMRELDGTRYKDALLAVKPAKTRRWYNARNMPHRNDGIGQYHQEDYKTKGFSSVFTTSHQIPYHYPRSQDSDNAFQVNSRQSTYKSTETYDLAHTRSDKRSEIVQSNPKTPNKKKSQRSKVAAPGPQGLLMQDPTSKGEAGSAGNPSGCTDLYSGAKDLNSDRYSKENKIERSTEARPSKEPERVHNADRISVKAKPQKRSSQSSSAQPLAISDGSPSKKSRKQHLPLSGRPNSPAADLNTNVSRLTSAIGDVFVNGPKDSDEESRPESLVIYNDETEQETENVSSSSEEGKSLGRISSADNAIKQDFSKREKSHCRKSSKHKAKGTTASSAIVNTSVMKVQYSETRDFAESVGKPDETADTQAIESAVLSHGSSSTDDRITASPISCFYTVRSSSWTESGSLGRSEQKLLLDTSKNGNDLSSTGTGLKKCNSIPEAPKVRKLMSSVIPAIPLFNTKTRTPVVSPVKASRASPTSRRSTSCAVANLPSVGDVHQTDRPESAQSNHQKPSRLVAGSISSIFATDTPENVHAKAALDVRPKVENQEEEQRITKSTIIHGAHTIDLIENSPDIQNADFSPATQRKVLSIDVPPRTPSPSSSMTLRSPSPDVTEEMKQEASTAKGPRKVESPAISTHRKKQKVFTLTGETFEQKADLITTDATLPASARASMVANELQPELSEPSTLNCQGVTRIHEQGVSTESATSKDSFPYQTDLPKAERPYDTGHDQEQIANADQSSTVLEQEFAEPKASTHKKTKSKSKKKKKTKALVSPAEPTTEIPDPPADRSYPAVRIAEETPFQNSSNDDNAFPPLLESVTKGSSLKDLDPVEEMRRRTLEFLSSVKQTVKDRGNVGDRQIEELPDEEPTSIQADVADYRRKKNDEYGPELLKKLNRIRDLTYGVPNLDLDSESNSEATSPRSAPNINAMVQSLESAVPSEALAEHDGVALDASFDCVTQESKDNVLELLSQFDPVQKITPEELTAKSQSIMKKYISETIKAVGNASIALEARVSLTADTKVTADDVTVKAQSIKELINEPISEPSRLSTLSEANVAILNKTAKDDASMYQRSLSCNRSEYSITSSAQRKLYSDAAACTSPARSRGQSQSQSNVIDLSHESDSERSTNPREKRGLHSSHGNGVGAGMGKGNAWAVPKGEKRWGGHLAPR